MTDISINSSWWSKHTLFLLFTVNVLDWFTLYGFPHFVRNVLERTLIKTLPTTDLVKLCSTLCLHCGCRVSHISSGAVLRSPRGLGHWETITETWPGPVRQLWGVGFAWHQTPPHMYELSESNRVYPRHVWAGPCAERCVEPERPLVATDSALWQDRSFVHWSHSSVCKWFTLWKNIRAHNHIKGKGQKLRW